MMAQELKLESKKLFFMTAIITCSEASETGIVREYALIWMVLSGLIIVGLAGLFWYSRKRVQRLQARLDKQLKMEQEQNIILTNMSENIHDIAQRTLDESHQMIQKSDHSNEEKKRIMNEVEEKLLSVTNGLIEYLQLKSKKVEIKNNQFNLNNVLNEISGTVCTNHAGKDIELIIDVNKNVPRFLIGDSLHLGQILLSIFDYSLNLLDKNDELSVEVSMCDTYEGNIQLQFEFRDTGTGLSEEEAENLFSPYYDEETGRYVGLGMYVAKELAGLMGGALNVQSISGKGTTFFLELPFLIPDLNDKRKYHLSSKVLTEKKVLIVDNSYHAALAIKRMFVYFKHDVKIVSKEEFEETIPGMEAYDIVLIHESLFNARLVRYLKQLKDQKELKVIVLKNLMRVNENRFEHEVIDAYFYKPLNQERVFELIIDLYEAKGPHCIDQEGYRDIPKAEVYQSDIIETKDVTQESFADFCGRNLLIVEDNVVNQKVLINLLRKSNINISLANDGEEAVHIVTSGEVDFDLILMDINMPVMDGYTATRRIRKDHHYDGVPIVSFTALILDSEKQKMFSSGMNAFLSKPLNIGKLYTVFSMYMSDKALHTRKKERQKEKEAVFEGLDIERGIGHANHNEALYIEMLKEFREVYGNSYEVFNRLDEEKSYEQMKMLCIDLRGLTGTIGALGLQHLISKIYQPLLYEKHELLPNLIHRSEPEFKNVFNSIDAYLTAQEA